jgi:hypothetical protein
VNSGKPDAGEGGVAVAAALLRSTGSGLAGAEGVGLGAAAGGTDRVGVTVPVSRGGGAEKIPSFQVLRGVGVGVGRDAAGEGSLVPIAVALLPDGGVACPVGAGIEMTPLQTEQRARTPLGGTLEGSTRKIDLQSGQLTFIQPLQSCGCRVSLAAAPAG